MTTIKTDISTNTNILSKRGDTFTLVLPVVGFDLTGWTQGKMQVKARASDDRVILLFETGDGLVISGNAINLDKPKEDMDFHGHYVYDIEAEKDGEVFTLFSGLFEISNDVTR